MNNVFRLNIERTVSGLLNEPMTAERVQFLLITLREYAKANEFKNLAELGDFIAHPNRDKGIVNDALDRVYSQWKYMPDNPQIGCLNYHHIKKNVFKFLFDDPIDAKLDEWIIEEFEKDKEALRDEISSYFQKRGRFYGIRSIDHIFRIKEIQTTLSKPPFQEPFNEAAILEELHTCLEQICAELEVDLDLGKFANHTYGNNIILCLLELLQDSRFVFHDEATGVLQVCTSKHNIKYLEEPKRKNQNLVLDAIVPIHLSFVQFTYLSTSALVRKVVLNPDTDVIWGNNSTGRLKTFRVARANEGK